MDAVPSDDEPRNIVLVARAKDLDVDIRNLTDALDWCPGKGDGAADWIAPQVEGREIKICGNAYR